MNDLLSEEHFLLEAFQCRWRGGEFRKNRLESNDTREFLIENLVHGPHPADTQGLDDLISSG
jgi:hypothetical protein